MRFKTLYCLPAFKMTDTSYRFQFPTPYRTKAEINKAFKKPELIYVFQTYQDEYQKNLKKIDLLEQKVEYYKSQATLQYQLKKGWKKHSVELPAFLSDIKKVAHQSVKAIGPIVEAIPIKF